MRGFYRKKNLHSRCGSAPFINKTKKQKETSVWIKLENKMKIFLRMVNSMEVIPFLPELFNILEKNMFAITNEKVQDNRKLYL